MSDRRELDRIEAEMDSLLGVEPARGGEYESLREQLGIIACSDLPFITLFEETWAPRNKDEVSERENRVISLLGDLGFSGAREKTRVKKIVGEDDFVVSTSFRYGGSCLSEHGTLFIMRKGYEVHDDNNRLRGGVNEVLVFDAATTKTQLVQETLLRPATIDMFEEYAKWATR